MKKLESALRKVEKVLAGLFHSTAAKRGLVAGLLITSEAMIAEKPEKKMPPMPPGEDF